MPRSVVLQLVWPWLLVDVCEAFLGGAFESDFCAGVHGFVLCAVVLHGLGDLAARIFFFPTELCMESQLTPPTRGQSQRPCTQENSRLFRVVSNSKLLS